jgi:hypothetical protein
MECKNACYVQLRRIFISRYIIYGNMEAFPKLQFLGKPPVLQICQLFSVFIFSQSTLGAISHNVPAVYNGFLCPIKEMRSISRAGKLWVECGVGGVGNVVAAPT